MHISYPKARLEEMALLRGEEPYELFLRVSLWIFPYEWNRIEKLFRHFVEKKFNLSTAAYRNAGLRNNQLASCFVATLEDDFVKNNEMLYDIKNVLKNGSALGVGLSKIRHADGIVSSGPIGMVKEIHSTATNMFTRPGKNADVALFLDDWHSSLFDFLQVSSSLSCLQFRLDKDKNLLAHSKKKY